MVLIYSGFLALSFFFFYKRLQEKQIAFLDRYSKAIFYPILVTLAFLVFYKIQWSLFDEHNWIRLERAIAWARGFNIYPGRETGALITNIYGPISAFVYLPAALMTTPMGAVKLGTIITFLLVAAPPVWIVLNQAEKKNRYFALLIAECVVFFLIMLTSLKYISFTIHADAAAHAFTALACGVLVMRGITPGFKHFLLASLFAVLAIWSKQVALPVVFAIFLWLLWVYGKQSALTFCGLVLGWVLIAFLIFAWMFPMSDIIFNILTVPGMHPLKPDLSERIFVSTFKLLRECLPVLGFAVFSLLPLIGLKGKTQKLSNWLKENPWTLFVLLSILMTPFSLWTNVKVGGGNNTFTYTNYYLWIGVMMSYLQFVTGERKFKIMTPHISQGFFLIVITIFLMIHVPVVFYRIHKYDRQPHFGEQAYEFALKYPGKSYFPRLTLVHLMAENKLYHSVDGLMDRKWAGMGPSREQLLKYVPENADFIAFHKGGENHFGLLKLEDQFKYMDKDPPELPGFTLYRKVERV